MTEEVPAVLAAMAAVMADVTHVGKDDLFDAGGRGAKYKFRGVDRVVSAISPAMRRHGIIMTPTCQAVPEWIPTTTNSGGNSNVVRVLVTYRIYAVTDGSFLELTVPGEAMDTGDKAVSKAMSVAWRTAIIQAFNLPIDTPEPDSENYQLSKGGKPSTRSEAAIQRTEARDAALAQWRELITGARGDKASMIRLYNEAIAAKAPTEVVNEILAAGKGL